MVLTLANSGKVAGSEVVQLYLSYPTSAGEPPQVHFLLHSPSSLSFILLSFLSSSYLLICFFFYLQVLRKFQKVMLNPGASAQVSFTLAKADISIWGISFINLPPPLTHSHSLSHSHFTQFYCIISTTYLMFLLDINRSSFMAVSGSFGVNVGSSSRDIRLKGTFTA